MIFNSDGHQYHLNDLSPQIIGKKTKRTAYACGNPDKDLGQM